MKRTLALLALAGASAMLAACGSGANATPSPSSAASSGSGSSGGSSSDAPLGKRPKDIDLTGVDPCKILTDTQVQQQLEYTAVGPPSTSDVDNAKDCTYVSADLPTQQQRDIGSIVALSTTVGASRWVTDTSRSSSEKQSRTTVQGFPALQIIHEEPSAKNHCSIVVDVHDGQYLEVYSGPPNIPSNPAPYCQEATKVANLVVQDLAAK